MRLPSTVVVHPAGSIGTVPTSSAPTVAPQTVSPSQRPVTGVPSVSTAVTPTSIESVQSAALAEPQGFARTVPSFGSPPEVSPTTVRTIETVELPEDTPDPVDVVRGRDSRDTVEPSDEAGHQPSAHHYYDPYYTGWYVHPYYRYQHYTTGAVYYPGYGYVDPWGPQWAPPGRRGWVWVPGYWANGFWHPGSWVPARHLAPRAGYVWVNGFWQHNHVYVDGYWRPEQREDGEWKWVEGYYLEDGSYVPGHWRPTAEGPEGYVWEPGFWKGEDYVDGFWRPNFRQGFTWQSAYYDEEGVFHAGFWTPVTEDAGFTWIPGWFDGQMWIEGYWVTDDEFQKELVSLDVGEGIGDGEVIDNQSPQTEPTDDKVPNLGIPVSFE